MVGTLRLDMECREAAQRQDMALTYTREGALVPQLRLVEVADRLMPEQGC